MVCDLALGWVQEDAAGTVIATGGCRDEAAAEYPSPEPEPSRVEPFYGLIGGMTRVVHMEVPEDARVAAVDAEWTVCMAEHGYPFMAEEGPAGDVRLPSPLSARSLAARTRPDGSVADPDYDAPAADVPWEERALVGSEYEIAIALADFDCRDEVNYVERLTDVRIDLEQRFVDANGEELDRMLRAFEAG